LPLLFANSIASLATPCIHFPPQNVHFSAKALLLLHLQILRCGKNTAKTRQKAVISFRFPFFSGYSKKGGDRYLPHICQVFARYLPGICQV